MILGDAGSTWSKIFRLGDEAVRVVPTRVLAQDDWHFAWATGHTARKRSSHFENDLISLSKGALTLIDESDFTVLDLGSRDAKLVSFDQRRPTRLDWSVGCAAATGATLEMIGRFYEVDFDEVPVTEAWAPVTCGTYALERVMDAVSGGERVEEAIGRLVHGVARNSFDFCGRPEKLYLSGGFTMNAPYVLALSRYTQVIPMGRTMPLAGMWAFGVEAGDFSGPVPEPLKNSICRLEP